MSVQTDPGSICRYGEHAGTVDRAERGESHFTKIYLFIYLFLFFSQLNSYWTMYIQTQPLSVVINWGLGLDVALLTFKTHFSFGEYM